MAVVDRPLFADEATGTFANIFAFRSRSGCHSILKMPKSRHFKSKLVKKQQGRFVDLCARWRALSKAEKREYSNAAPPALGGFAWFLHVWGVARYNIGPEMPVDYAWSTHHSASGIGVFGNVIFMLEGYSSAWAIYGPYDLSTIQTLISVSYSMVSAVAYGYRVDAFAAVIPHSMDPPPAHLWVNLEDDAFSNMFEPELDFTSHAVWCRLEFLNLFP